MTTMRDFPIFDMATETMTLRLKCWRSRISLVDETSRFFLACAYTRSFCVFTGVATVNVFFISELFYIISRKLSLCGLFWTTLCILHNRSAPKRPASTRRHQKVLLCL